MEFGVPQARLLEYIYPGDVFPLWVLHADSMWWQPGSLDATMCGLHQRNFNTTLDINARPWVRLPPLCGQATGYPLQVTRPLHPQQSIHQVNKGGELLALLEACLQVHPLLLPLRLLQALFWWLRQMWLGISVHDTHVVNTVINILPEDKDQEVSLLFCGLWWWCIVPTGQTYGPIRLSLRPLYGATCKDVGFVVHVRGGECFAGQVCNPVPELVMTLRDKASPLAIKGVTYGECGVVSATWTVEWLTSSLKVLSCLYFYESTCHTFKGKFTTIQVNTKVY